MAKKIKRSKKFKVKKVTGLDFIDLRYKPTKNDLLVEYYAEPEKRMSLPQLCEHLAAESSIGTWTTISTMNPQIARRLKPHVYYINNKTKIVKIAYKSELFEAGNMPGILSSIAGNVFGMKAVKNLKLIDISFPKKIIDKFLGPQHGINGLRRLTNVRKRPLCGTIVKPKVGLNEKQHAKVAYEAWVGGLDAVKDDENLTSMSFNNFYKRARETLKLRDKAEKETGEKKLYFANITSETDEMLKRAKLVKQLGGEYLMVDILTAGWAGLQTVRKFVKKNNMFIHAHRAMHGAITRNPKHGISMNAIAKCARLIGVESLHIGTSGVGKMHGTKEEEIDIEIEIEHQFIHESDTHRLLQQRWYNIKPVMAVASGGLHPGSIPKLIKVMGTNIVAQAGGGVHWHPKGTRFGARGFRDAIEGTMKKINLRKYAKTHKELGDAIDKFGIVK